MITQKEDNLEVKETIPFSGKCLEDIAKVLLKPLKENRQI